MFLFCSRFYCVVGMRLAPVLTGFLYCNVVVTGGANRISTSYERLSGLEMLGLEM